MPDEEEETRWINTEEGETCAKLRFQVLDQDVNAWLKDQKVVQRGEADIHGFRIGSLCVLLTAIPVQQQKYFYKALPVYCLLQGQGRLQIVY